MADPKVTLVIRARDATRGVIRGIRSNLLKLGGAIAGAFALAEVARFTKDSAAAAREIRNLADGLGVSTDRFQALVGHMEQFGANADDVSDLLFNLQTARSDALSEGGEEMAESFRQLGITMGALRSGNDPVAMLFAMAIQAKRAGDEVGDLQEHFNRVLGEDNGRRFMAMLRQGPGALLRGMEESRQRGAIVDEERLRTASEGVTAVAEELQEAQATAVVAFAATTDAATATAAALRDLGEQARQQNYQWSPTNVSGFSVTG